MTSSGCCECRRNVYIREVMAKFVFSKLRYSLICIYLFIFVVTDFVICLSSTPSIQSSTPSTTANKISNVAATTAPASAFTVPANTDLAYCTSNLRPGQCDVDCCCDPDCTASDRLSFSSCTDQFTPPVNTRACIQNSQVFIENTPNTVQVTQDGLFCVSFDNYNSANYYEPPTLITTSSQFDSYLDTYGSAYSYSQNTGQSTGVPKTNNTNYYVSGDPIIVVYNTSSQGGTLGVLALPASSASSEACVNTNPAEYLYGQTHVCTQLFSTGDLATECTSNPMFSANTYYNNFKVATTPALFYTSNGSVSTVPLYDNPQLIAITTINAPLQPVYTSTNVCQNVVKQVEYSIAYGGTSGIASVSVQFTYVDLALSMLPLSQTFKTSFYQNGTINNETAYSGNPGYLVGEPVRAGTYDEATKTIQLGPVRTQWLTVVASKADGLCVDSIQDRVPVRFGINMRTGCFVSLTFNNMSSTCNETQAYAVSALLGNLPPPNRIAPFGNTSVSNANSWVPVLVTTSNLCSLSGTSNGLKPGQCNNIITGLNLQIVYANVGAINNPQPAIIGAEYQFYCQSLLQFQCVGPYCQPSTLNTTAQKFEISSSVTFVDASNPPVGAYGQIPSVSSSLPADFFYPFS